MLEFLSGKKTYIAAVGLALVAFAAFLNGDIDTVVLLQRVLEAFGLAGLRAGITKGG
jgi:hypothetical protein